tara:strand:+ start:492 stop:1121 length:630 start_codon:yes stop_codon:yes gene_type:complete
MKELTLQQKKVLQCIKFYIKKTGFPPTRADICRELGFKSPNAAESHLRALEKKSYISIEKGASRGINLINDYYKFADNNEDKYQSIPVVGLVAAGSPTLADENIEKHIPFQDSLFLSEFDYFLRVKGLSMKDAGIMEDDLVAIKKTSEVRNGDIVVARIEDEVTLKYFQSSGDQIKLIPANDDFEEIHISKETEGFFIEGKSVGLIREN